jgi:hypothetical protein
MNDIEKLEKLINYLEDRRSKKPPSKYRCINFPPADEEIEKKIENLSIYIGGDNEKLSS